MAVLPTIAEIVTIVALIALWYRMVIIDNMIIMAIIDVMTVIFVMENGGILYRP